MPNYDTIFSALASFICALFLLEYGADKFIDHTAIVARRTGISPALIGLLTAGAEWEEVRLNYFKCSIDLGPALVVC